MSDLKSCQTFADGSPALLAPDEPAPFEILNPEAPAAILLICDHASRYIPRSLDNLGLDAAALSRHIAWDIGIEEVTRRLSDHLQATAVLSRFSRLVIDPNRTLDSGDSIPVVSDNHSIPGNQDLTAEEVARRVRDLFDPYHNAIESCLKRLTQTEKTPVILSMHSFTPVMKSFERPWKIGILWNRDPRLPVPLMEKLRALGLPVGDNQPYSGRDRHGYTQQRHADRHGRANALIELRQDLIDTRKGAQAWADLLAGVLEEVLQDPALFKASSDH